jgi:glycosyltransferase involved in cell wall biosynthesis
VAAELLSSLARHGHRIDCFFPAAEGESPVQTAGDEQVVFGEGNLDFGENVTFIWGTSKWQWGRWYSRGKVTAFASGMFARTVASLRLRRAIARRHSIHPYDLIYQFSSIETPGVPASVARVVPVVIHPETHAAGELRWLIAERRLALRCQPPYVLAIAVAMMCVRTLVQRRAIHRADLLVCISSVFRDHLVRDYRFPPGATIVIPNPVRTDRFSTADRGFEKPATVLVLGRISARKGIDDVVTVTRLLLEREPDVRIRVIGGPTLWSDYTKLLEDLPRENTSYVGSLPAGEVSHQLLQSDILLQASKYEPFGLTVGEALAAGVPVVATSEVGAIEGVDRAVVRELAPGDAAGMTAAIVELLEALQGDPRAVRSAARSEAERLFAPEVVSDALSAALERLVAGA